MNKIDQNLKTLLETQLLSKLQALLQIEEDSAILLEKYRQSKVTEEDYKPMITKVPLLINFDYEYLVNNTNRSIKSIKDRIVEVNRMIDQ